MQNMLYNIKKNLHMSEIFSTFVVYLKDTSMFNNLKKSDL